MKREVSKYYANSLFSLPLELLAKKGYKVFLIDLDNTLTSPFSKKPDKRSYDLFERLYKLGIDAYIISNNHKKRVEEFASRLKVRYVYHAFKPFKFKIERFILQNGLNKSKILLVGDQIINDMYLSRSLKVDGLLVNPISKKDNIYTKLIRPFDKAYKKRLIKENRLGTYLKESEE